MLPKPFLIVSCLGKSQNSSTSGVHFWGFFPDSVVTSDRMFLKACIVALISLLII